MMTFPGMLITACEQAGIPYPNEEELKIYETSKDEKKVKAIAEKYPRFHIFCILQLGRAINMGEHWENAKIIAAFPEEKLKIAMLEDFLAAGVRWQ